MVYLLSLEKRIAESKSLVLVVALVPSTRNKHNIVGVTVGRTLFNEEAIRFDNGSCHSVSHLIRFPNLPA